MTTLKGGAALNKDAGRGIARAIAERYTPLGAAVTSITQGGTAGAVAPMRSGGGQGDVSNLADVDRLFAATTETRSASSSPTRASSRKISARWSSPRPISIA